MRIVQEPLTESEVEHLRQLLSDCAARSLEYARGVFTATATSPTPSVPTDWLPLLLGSDIPTKQALEESFSLLMREYNSVCECLTLGVPAIPAPDATAAVREFSQGYVRVVQKSEPWKLDKTAFALLMPIAVLSEYVKAESLNNLAPEFAASPEDWTNQQRQQLTETVMQSYSYWKDAREQSAQAEAVASAEPALAAPDKVGRNDECPCKSGKKYKRCCGAPS